MEVKFRPTSIDITGKRYGKLVAVRFHSYVDGGRGRSQKWLFKCDCGKDSVILKSHVTKKVKPTHSCGCLSKKHFKDFTGKTINNMQFLRAVGRNKYKCWMWEIRCFCGREFVTEGNDITSGKIKSCGCKLNSEQLKNANYEESIRNSLYAQLKNRGPRRGHNVTLTREEHHKLISGDCYYCGQSPNQTKKLNGHQIFANGIDRLDNDIGYELSNCVTACRNCNQAKHMMTPEYFKKWLGKVFDFKEKKEGFWKDV